MKKIPAKTFHPDNTLENFPPDKEPSLLKANNQQNFAMTSIESNVTTGLDSAHEKKVLKYPKKLEASKSSDSVHLKLTNSVRELFLEIKQKTLIGSPSSVLSLRRSVPFEDPDDSILGVDPLVLLQYIKQIFDKVLETKNEAERDLREKNDNECGDYESMLQKLEAEVRQHIRIEQQLKLYVESIQSKLDEHEKEGDLPKVDVQKELEVLQKENSSLHNKLKEYEDEIKTLKKNLSKKVEKIEKLERQIENIPVLKKMVREMDKVLDIGPSNKSVNESTLRGSQRSSESHGQSNISYGARKGSHPTVSSQSQDKHRDSNEYIRVIDSSTTFNEKSRQRESSLRDRIQKEGPKVEGNSLKSTARLEDKSEEMDDNQKRRKSFKGEKRQNSKERHTDQDTNNEDSHARAVLTTKMKEDIIEPSRLSCDAAFRIGMEEYLKKSIEKAEGKTKKKTNDSSIHKKPKTAFTESRIEPPKGVSQKSASSKPARPGTAGERASHNDNTRHSIDHHVIEAYRSKEVPAKKQGYDRSQSVEPKKKFLRQHKSRGSINEDEVEEHHRKQASFSGYPKGNTHSKTNQSGSAGFGKTHT